MMLAVRTDKPEAELYICSVDGSELEKHIWQAHRNLSKDIHKKISELFAHQKMEYKDLVSIIFYKGPGSFTGLRIGASVVNILATELDIPIAGVNGDDWIQDGIVILAKNPETRIVIPEYGAEPKITKPKK